MRNRWTGERQAQQEVGLDSSSGGRGRQRGWGGREEHKAQSLGAGGGSEKQTHPPPCKTTSLHRDVGGGNSGGCCWQQQKQMGLPLWGKPNLICQDNGPLQAGLGLSCPAPWKPSITSARTKDMATCTCPPPTQTHRCFQEPSHLLLFPLLITTTVAIYCNLTGYHSFHSYLPSSSHPPAFYKRGH